MSFKRSRLFHFTPQKSLILAFSLLFAFIFWKSGLLSSVKGTSCGSTCTDKEVGTIDGLNNFNSTSTLVKGQPYWIRLTIKGEDGLAPPQPSSTPTPVGVDTMMMLDLSSSMNNSYPKNNPDNGVTVLQYQAAQAALNSYIDISDQKNDYLGFGSFLWCGSYLNSATPVWWSYDDYNRVNAKMVGFSAIHIPLKPINSAPNTYKSVINSIAYNSKNDPDFCSGTGVSHVSTTTAGPYIINGEFNGGTSLGGAITAAETFLTPILNDAKAKRSDGTSYRDSKKSNTLPTYTKNMGPYARQYTLGQAIPKYIILGSDGAEGVPPLVNDIDIDKNARAIVNNAKFYGVKIFMAVTKRKASLPANTVSRIDYITTTTGGKAYYGNSQQELVANFSNIRNDIVVDSGGGGGTPTPVARTNITVTEKVNSAYFKVDEPTHNAPITFKITQPGPPETDITNINCNDLNADTVPDCISNKKYDASGNLVGYDITLDPLSFGQTRYIYLRVTPTQSSNGSSVDVDYDPVSVVNYKDIPRTVTIKNTQVTIGNPSPFFQGYSSGDIYSASSDVASSIKSSLPLVTDEFSTQGDNLVIHKGGSFFGNGMVNSKHRELSQYTLDYDQAQLSYNTLYTEYSSLIPASNIKSISGISDFTSSGYYMDSSSQTNGKYEIQGSGWSGQTLTDKKVVMFIPGNLYINTNFSVQKNGNSIIVFIVKGRVGIDPSVTNVQGVYIYDGVLDTACNSVSAFAANNKCAPDAGAAGTSNQLTLEGIFVSNSIDSLTGLYSGAAGGFNLDRSPANTTIPSEKFVYRPDFLMTSSLSVGRKNYTWIENLQ